MEAQIVELLGDSDTTRQFRVSGVSTGDKAMTVVAQYIQEGDRHPWCSHLTAGVPRCAKTMRLDEHIVTLDYTKGTP